MQQITAQDAIIVYATGDRLLGGTLKSGFLQRPGDGSNDASTGT
jgi:hypothetical protein